MNCPYPSRISVPVANFRTSAAKNISDRPLAVNYFKVRLTCKGRTDYCSWVEAYKGCKASRKTPRWALLLSALLNLLLLILHFILLIEHSSLIFLSSLRLPLWLSELYQIIKLIVRERYRKLWILVIRGLVLALKRRVSCPLWQLKQAGLVMTDMHFISHSRAILSSSHLLRFIAITNDVIILETTGVSQTFLLHIQILKM